jgi:hypothetical protein
MGRIERDPDEDLGVLVSGVFVCVYIYIYIYIYNFYTQAYLFVRVRVYACAHTYAYKHTNTHMYTYMQVQHVEYASPRGHVIVLNKHDIHKIPPMDRAAYLRKLDEDALSGVKNESMDIDELEQQVVHVCLFVYMCIYIYVHEYGCAWCGCMRLHAM